MVGEGEHLRIDRLVIRVESADETTFQTTFIKALEKAVSQYRSGEQKGESKYPKPLNREAALHTALIYFLRYGSTPWNASPEMMAEVRRKIRQLPAAGDPELIRQLRETGVDHPVIWQRLGYITGIDGFETLLSRHLNFSAEDLAHIRTRAEKQEPAGSRSEQRMKYYASILQTLGKETGLPLKSIMNHLGNLESKKYREQASGAQKKETTGQPVDFLEGIFIENAGLVLLWTALGRLFRELGMVEGKKFIDTETQQRAILLLHYLVYGQAEAWEDHLLLNKILCGWEPEAPVDVQLAPGEAEQKSADELLENLIGLWMGEKKFSKAFIRQVFLQREGKLIQRPEGNWHLQVTGKTEDILLSKFPAGWSYNLIKYTWMKNILFVDW